MQRVGFVVSPGLSLMGLTATTVFEIANLVQNEDVYDLHFISEHGGPVRASSGIRLDTEPFGDMSFETLIVGAVTEPQPASSGLIDLVKSAAGKCRRVAAVCTGAFILAEAICSAYDEDGVTDFQYGVACCSDNFRIRRSTNPRDHDA